MFRSSNISLKREPLASHTWESIQSRFFDEMDRVLDRYNLRLHGNNRRSFIPRIEVMENDKSIHVDAELPGVEVSDIDVALTDDTLIIRGEKKEEPEHGRECVCCSERAFGTFYREIRLSKNVDVTRAEASYANGVLCINLPKSNGRTARKKIPIRNPEASIQ